MDDDFRREQAEAERQGRAAYMSGKDRNPTWPTDFLAGYDRAQDEDDIESRPKPRVSGRPATQAIDLTKFKGADE